MLKDVVDSPFLSVFLRCIAFNFSKIPKNAACQCDSVVTEHLYIRTCQATLPQALHSSAADFFLAAGWCSTHVSTFSLAFNSTWTTHLLTPA